MTRRASFPMFSVNNNNFKSASHEARNALVRRTQKMRDDIDAALVVALKREKEEKINELRQKAQELGLDINDVMAGASGRKASLNTKDQTEKSGLRGRTPCWVLEVIGEDKVDLKKTPSTYWRCNLIKSNSRG